jgi:dihydropteroate synthase
MKKYYTRPCNFYYGSYARQLVKNKKAYPLAGNPNIAFDKIEFFTRKDKKIVKNIYYPINKIQNINKKIKSIIKKDLKNIVSKRKSILGLKFNKPQIMGVLNLTPDSFSDGGLFFKKKSSAYKQATIMIKSGATIIDIGGESTRPNSKTIDESQEWKRIKNIIKKVKKKFKKTPLSLDTRKSNIMKKGIDNGVNIINDVSGLNFDNKSFEVINSKKIPFVLNHMKGQPSNMQENPIYDDVLLDIYDFFKEKINFCVKNNYKKDFIIIDPGIGFGKNLNHNLRIISKISIFHSLGCPILIGVSRKKFIEHIVTKFDTSDRTGGTLASVLYGLSQGVQIFRVHNVKEINQGILVFNKILNTN